MSSDPTTIKMSKYSKQHHPSQEYHHMHQNSQNAFITNIQLDQNGFQTVEQGEQRISPMISGEVPWNEKAIPTYQKKQVTKKKKAKASVRTSRTVTKSKRPGTTTMSTQEAESTDRNHF